MTYLLNYRVVFIGVTYVRVNSDLWEVIEEMTNELLQEEARKDRQLKLF